jgi:hypothetical protein
MFGYSGQLFGFVEKIRVFCTMLVFICWFSVIVGLPIDNDLLVHYRQLIYINLQYLK